MDFSRVVSAKIEIQFLLLRAIEPFLAKFSRHQRIDARRKKLGHSAVARTTAKGDRTRVPRSAFDADNTSVQALEFFAQLRPLKTRRCDASNRFAVADEKGARGRESELFSEQCVIADLGMTIERQMIRIERAVVANQRGNALVDGPDEHLRHVPKHAMMHDQKIHTGRSGFLK